MSTTLKQARQALGRGVGGWIPAVASAGSQSSATLPEAFASSTMPSSALAFRWLFSPLSIVPRQRRVLETGLSGGVVNLDGLLGTPITSGTVVELSSYLPCVQQDGNFGQSFQPGLHECLQWASEHILVPQTDYLLQLVSNQRFYDLPLWLMHQERLLSVQHRAPTGSASGPEWVDAESHGHVWEIVSAADGPQLHFHAPYRFTGGPHMLNLSVLRPANTWVKVGGVWADGTGMTNETDEIGVELDQLIPVALAYAYAAIRDSRTGTGRATFDAMYERQVALARQVRGYDHATDIDPSVGAGTQQAPVARAS